VHKLMTLDDVETSFDMWVSFNRITRKDWD